MVHNWDPDFVRQGRETAYNEGWSADDFRRVHLSRIQKVYQSPYTRFFTRRSVEKQYRLLKEMQERDREIAEQSRSRLRRVLWRGGEDDHVKIQPTASARYWSSLLWKPR